MKRKSPLKRNKKYANTRQSKGASRSTGKLKKDLWRVFSLYIRTRDGYTCICCGRHASGGAMHAGHYIARAVGGLDLCFDERNVNAQCYHCNINLSGNSDVYVQKIVERYGEGILEELRSKRNGPPVKWSEQDYIEKIAYYKKKLHELDNKQNHTA